MKAMCPPGYHRNGFVATHALGHMMYMMYRHMMPHKYVYTNIYIYICAYMRNIYMNIYKKCEKGSNTKSDNKILESCLKLIFEELSSFNLSIILLYI